MNKNEMGILLILLLCYSYPFGIYNLLTGNWGIAFVPLSVSIGLSCLWVIFPP